MRADPDPVLPLGAVGDLVAARRVARLLLRAAGSPGESALDTLIVTAACLEAELVAQDDVRRRDVSDVLCRLQADRSPGASFAPSPSAFVRYVGAELSDRSSDECRSRLSRLIAVIHPPDTARDRGAG